MKNKKVLVVSLVILLIAVIGIFGYKAMVNSKAVDGSKKIVVTVVNDAASYSKEHTYQTDATTLGAALEEMQIVKLQDGPYGRFLVGADDFSADEAKQEWWRVVVNGNDAEVGIDSIMLNDGDAFELILMIGW